MWYRTSEHDAPKLNCLVHLLSVLLHAALALCWHVTHGSSGLVLTEGGSDGRLLHQRHCHNNQWRPLSTLPLPSSTSSLRAAAHRPHSCSSSAFESHNSAWTTPLTRGLSTSCTVQHFKFWERKSSVSVTLHRIWLYHLLVGVLALSAKDKPETSDLMTHTQYELIINVHADSFALHVFSPSPSWQTIEQLSSFRLKGEFSECTAKKNHFSSPMNHFRPLEGSKPQDWKLLLTAYKTNRCNTKMWITHWCFRMKQVLWLLRLLNKDSLRMLEYFYIKILVLLLC